MWRRVHRCLLALAGVLAKAQLGERSRRARERARAVLSLMHLGWPVRQHICLQAAHGGAASATAVSVFFPPRMGTNAWIRA